MTFEIWPRTPVPESEVESFGKKTQSYDFQVKYS